MKKYIYILIFLFSFPLSALAAEIGISASPQIFELDVFPGETISRKIKAQNLSSLPLPLNVRVVDFDSEENSGEMIFDEQSQDPSVSSRQWFEISSANLILESEESREIDFTIRVPKNVEPRGYYSMMILQPQLPSFYFQEHELLQGSEESISLPKAIPVIGIIFLISIKSFSLDGEEGEKMEVLDFSLPQEKRAVKLENIFSKIFFNVAWASQLNIAEDNPEEFVVKIKNNDKYHIRPFGTVSVYNLFGKKIGEAEIERKTILPGRTRIFSARLVQEEKKGNYFPSFIIDFFNFKQMGQHKAKLDLQAKTAFLKEAIITKNPFFLNFFILPQKAFVIFLLLLLLMVAFFIKRKESLAMALRVILLGEKKR